MRYSWEDPDLMVGRKGEVKNIRSPFRLQLALVFVR